MDSRNGLPAALPPVHPDIPNRPRKPDREDGKRHLRDILDFHPSPPDRAVVLRVDEKSRIRALDRTQPVLPMRPGIPGGPTITGATGRPRCTPPSTSPPAPS